MSPITNATTKVTGTAYTPKTQVKETEIKTSDVKIEGKKPYSGFAPGLALYSPDITVGSLPYEIRDARSHPDDSGSGVPIRDVAYETRISGEISCNYVKGGKYLTTYAGLGLIIELAHTEGSNYQGGEPGSNDRGYGAALTCAMVGKAGLLTNMIDEFGMGRGFIDIVPRVGAEINLTDKTSIGAKLSYFMLAARTGWDRYDAIECDKNYALAHFFPLDLYVRLDEAIVLGVRTLELNTLTKYGEDSDISYNKFSPYISFGF